jgi:CubicO group peptidase (beta-lactamase class C family)
MAIWEPVNNLMQAAVAENIFPGGVLLVSKANTVAFFEAYGYADIFSKRPATKETVFDLASLTKPLATTLAVMRLILQGRMELDQQLGSILPRFKNSDKSRITIKHLLCHNSGLPDYRPYYRSLDKVPPHRRKDALYDLLAEEPLVNPIGVEVLYSDLGFMVLNRAVERIAAQGLDRFVAAEIYSRLGLENLFFVKTGSKGRGAQFAATEHCPWRGFFLDGVVHDENAYAVGGIDGHAGLFGTAEGVYCLLKALLAEFHGKSADVLFERKLVQLFFKPHNNTGRALGFDTPSATESSCGRYFSPNSVGHLGFTGTSFWMDLDRHVIVILLTNRVHPSRDNLEIKSFRPKLHDMVMGTIALDR